MHGGMGKVDKMKMNFDYTLYIFDLDGTLAQFKTGRILDGVQEWFSNWLSLPEDERPYIALASNQGGVGLRYWMESSGFGNPENYPTQEDIETHIRDVLTEIGIDEYMSIYVSYRYQSKKGNWSPIPDYAYNDNKTQLINKSWSMDYRKPCPDMLLDAMAMHFVDKSETVMIGDWQEDKDVATNAGIDFIHADEFFQRETVDDLPF